MKQVLNFEQQSQALVWHVVMGFTHDEIGDHFGISTNQVSFELKAARLHRKSAGKSPEPVPVKQHPMERQRTHADVLMDCTTALLSIVEACNERTAYHAVNHSRFVAEEALKKAGIQP